MQHSGTLLAEHKNATNSAGPCPRVAFQARPVLGQTWAPAGCSQIISYVSGLRPPKSDLFVRQRHGVGAHHPAGGQIPKCRGVHRQAEGTVRWCGERRRGALQGARVGGRWVPLPWLSQARLGHAPWEGPTHAMGNAARVRPPTPFQSTLAQHIQCRTRTMHALPKVVYLVQRPVLF